MPLQSGEHELKANYVRSVASTQLFYQACDGAQTCRKLYYGCTSSVLENVGYSNYTNGYVLREAVKYNENLMIVFIQRRLMYLYVTL